MKQPESDGKDIDVHTCPVCGQKIDTGEDNVGYVRTKRKTEVFVHHGCVKNWGNGNGKS